jgi:two-component system response regulator YesN
MGYLKLIIVDDDILICKGLSLIIERIAPQWTVAGHASNGVEGLELIQHILPQLIITDISMPHQSGIDMYSIVKAQFPKIKCIVLSGYTEFEYARTMMRLGAVDYLIKPVEEELLLEHLTAMEKQIVSESKEKLIQREEKLQLSEYWFQQLVSGIQYETQVCESNLHRLGIATDSAFFVLYCLNLDLSDKGHHDQSTYLFYLFKTAEELIESDGRVYHGEKDDVFVFMWGEELPALEHRMKIFEEDLLQFIQQTTHLAVTIGSSTPFENMYDFREAFQRCKVAVKYKTLLGNFTLDNSLHEENGETPDRTHPHQIGNDILAALHQKDKDKISKIITRAFLANNSDSLASLEHLHHLFLSIIFRLEEFSIQNGTQLEVVKGCSLMAIADQYREVKNIHHAVKSMIELATNLLDHIENHRNAIDPHTIRKIKQFIKEHLNDNLTLQSVAEHVHLHPNYLSDLFKQATGQNFIDHVIQVRIDVAIELLKEDKYKWYEISDKVGYQSSKHFTKLFKKLVGMSPSDFKKSMIH